MYEKKSVYKTPFVSVILYFHKVYLKDGGAMRIRVLAENTAKEGFLCEHGLSLLVETDAGRKILFDMGQSDLFAANAKELSLDLASVDTAVLSHGHYDHGGGLSRFLQVNKKAPVYISRYAFGEYYNGQEKYITDCTIDTDMELLIPDSYRKNKKIL